MLKQLSYISISACADGKTLKIKHKSRKSLDASCIFMKAS